MYEQIFYIFGMLVLLNKLRGVILNADANFSDKSKALSKSLESYSKGDDIDSINTTLDYINKDLPGTIRRLSISIIILIWEILGVATTQQWEAFIGLMCISLCSLAVGLLVIKNESVYKHAVVIQRIIEFFIVLHILVNYFIN